MLGYINYNETVEIETASGGVDAFGIPIKSESKVYKCYIKENMDLTPISSADGTLCVIDYFITVDGNCKANAGDYLTINGSRCEIKSKKYIRDFDRNIISTKYGVKS